MGPSELGGERGNLGRRTKRISSSHSAAFPGAWVAPSEATRGQQGPGYGEGTWLWLYDFLDEISRAASLSPSYVLKCLCP